MKPTGIHYHRAQRIYDRLGRGSVADIDAIAQALAEAERGGRDDTDSANLLSIIADIREKSGLGAKPMLGDLAGAIAERIANAEREGKRQAADTAAAVKVAMPEWAEIAPRQFDAGSAVTQEAIVAAILSTIPDEAR